MTYGIKTKKESQRVANNLKWNFWELENLAYKKYGTSYKDLSIKEQDEISKEVAKGFHYKIY